MNRKGKKFLKAVAGKFLLLRKNQMKKLDEVAEAVKLSPLLIERIESGDYDLRLDLLFTLCEYYDIAPEEFLKEVEKHLQKLK